MLKKILKTPFVPLVAVFLFFMVLSFWAESGRKDFLTSVIPTQPAAPYDGIVPPIAKVPKWTELKNWKLDYSQIPADKLRDFPVYDAEQLKIPSSKLNWSKESDRAIR